MKLLKLISLLWLLAIIQCSRSTSDVAEGGGSHTGNGTDVSGIVVDAGGNVMANTEVLMVPVGFNPAIHSASLILRDTTDENGAYLFDNINMGSYNMELYNPSSNTVALVKDIWVASDTLTALPETQLLSASTMVIEIPENVNIKSTFVYIPGTNFISSINDNGTVILENIPKGDIPSIYLYDSTSSDPHQELVLPIKVVLDTVNVFLDSIIPLDTSGTDTTNLDTIPVHPYNDWKYSKKVYLNTSSTGANVSGSVYQFPILVRLKSSNFNFLQTPKGQVEIRFTDHEDKPLTHETERWNESQKSAQIWVLVDSVLGDNSDQFIKMFWGSPNDSDITNGNSVFNPSNGFGAVWHLKEESLDTGSQNVYQNSVEDDNHGNDFVTLPSGQGVVGRGAELSWGDYIQVANASDRLKPLTSYTLSAWIRTSNVDKTGSTIVSMGDDYAMRLNPDIGDLRAFIYDNSSNANPVVSNTPVNDDVWHHCVSVYYGTELVVYVDGVLMGRRYNMPPSINYNLGPNFNIGLHGIARPNYKFKGRIDEVRMSRITRSEAWIQLSFQNQKSSQKLVEFR